jgi:hypothetical protein
MIEGQWTKSCRSSSGIVLRSRSEEAAKSMQTLWLHETSKAAVAIPKGLTLYSRFSTLDLAAYAMTFYHNGSPESDLFRIGTLVDRMQLDGTTVAGRSCRIKQAINVQYIQ